MRNERSYRFAQAGQATHTKDTRKRQLYPFRVPQPHSKDARIIAETFGVRLRSEERTQLPLCGGRAGHEDHETLESGSFTLSGLRSRTPNALHHALLQQIIGTMPKTIIAWPHAPPHRLTLGGTYFVTAGTYQKAQHFRGRERLEVVQRGLLKTLQDGGWQLEAWAIFSNHYHFVASASAPANLGTLLKTFHSKLALWINRLDATPGRKVWHNFRETLLTFDESYFARLNYTHHNAVKHGLVPVARDYPWCSARWFEEMADQARVKTIYGFKYDQVKVEDDYPIAPDW